MKKHLRFNRKQTNVNRKENSPKINQKVLMLVAIKEKSKIPPKQIFSKTPNYENKV